MVHREYRKHEQTPLERERLDRKECPVCGHPARSFHFCCSPACTSEYWGKNHPTISQMRDLVADQQENKCAHCKGPLWPTGERYEHPFVLDHIIPLAMGGPQWRRDNLHCLCSRCNKAKTARDMGRIAQFKRFSPTDQDPTRQVTLF